MAGEHFSQKEDHLEDGATDCMLPRTLTSTEPPPPSAGCVTMHVRMPSATMESSTIEAGDGAAIAKSGTEVNFFHRVRLRGKFHVPFRVRCEDDRAAHVFQPGMVESNWEYAVQRRTEKRPAVRFFLGRDVFRE